VQEKYSNALTKEYIFKDFRQAWAFMSGLTEFINETDHHPDWTNVYNKVKVTLSTHDLNNTVSDKDVALAKRMEEEYQRINKS
jgi:4a-hydroxytetrahydrobiopterin dehydratase